MHRATGGGGKLLPGRIIRRSRSQLVSVRLSRPKFDAGRASVLKWASLTRNRRLVVDVSTKTRRACGSPLSSGAFWEWSAGLLGPRFIAVQTPEPATLSIFLLGLIFISSCQRVGFCSRGRRLMGQLS
ncbi:MAG: PEP-CTERM sorting domain-containing protein [Phycisphaerae bacterium]